MVGQERQDGKHDHPDATQNNGCRAVLTFFQHILIVSLGGGSRRRDFSILFAEIEPPNRGGTCPGTFQSLDVSGTQAASLVFARDEVERDFTGLSESHSSIEVDGALVGGADMKPGDEAFATMVSRKVPDQVFRIAFAAVIGVRADSTDLGIALEGEALTAHRDQSSVGANAEVKAHLAGSGAEEAWECEVGEGYHLGCMVV